MKKAFFLLSVVCILGLCFSGCKKDEENPDPYFEVAGENCETLTWGLLFNLGQSVEDYEGTAYYLYLFSSGFTYNEGNVYGSGDMLAFFVISSTSSSLATDTYNGVVYNEQYISAGTFLDDSFWQNTENEDGANIPSGTLKIKNNGNQAYEMTVNCTDSNGDAVKAFFDGSLTLLTLSKSTALPFVSPLEISISRP